MRVAVLSLLIAGCSSSTQVVTVDSGTVDAASDVVVEGASDVASEVTPEVATDAGDARRCATTGKGAVAGDVCLLLTPAECGLSGANAAVNQYALRPVTGARGRLMIFFNGSGGSPLAGTKGTPATNFYTTARSAGLHVFAVSYRSDDSIGSLCKGDDACFLPTRRAILTGVSESGTASAVSSIAPAEGAYARIAGGLTYLAAHDPSGGWDAFFDASKSAPSERIRWSLVIATGHSQGGGHAALIGRSFAIDRVVALSSPCDQTAAGPASWLDATKSTYATSPAVAFHGIGAPGDTICPGYPASWTALGLDASRKHPDAIVCAGSTLGAHSATIECVENAPAWTSALE